MVVAAAAAVLEDYVGRVRDAFRGRPRPGDGVPGDWVTGDRFVDITLLPIVWAFGFVLLRRVLRTTVFEPAGLRVMQGRMKKSGRKRWDAAKREGWMTKWNESCWKCFVYTVSTAAVFLSVLWEPYLLNPIHFWGGATAFPLNYRIPFKHLMIYTAQLGFYLQAVPFLMFVEVRRKDWAESFAHHVVTLGLQYYSFWANFTRAGIIIMLLHDVSDIFLEAAKLSRYAGRQSAATAWFAAFAGSWVVLRVFIYPRVVVLNCLISSVIEVALPYDIEPQPHYAVFGTLFSVLYFLHLYWTWLILQVIWRQVKGKELGDVREDDDEDSD